MSNRLPDSWILKIFDTMQAHYGSRWTNLWKMGKTLPNGIDYGMANAMETWAVKLAPYQNKPEALRKVMDNLPIDPPSLPQFMDLLKHCYVHTPTLQIDNQLTDAQKELNKARIQEILKTVCKKV
jgi:hypothetical protein